MVCFSASRLTCRRGERLVFGDLDFTARSGDAVLLTGRNGSGKSSLLHICAGLMAPHCGRIAWDGVDAGTDAPAHRARLRYVGHRDAVKPVLSVRENLILWARLYEESAPDTAIASALETLGMLHLIDVPGRHLSSGQKRCTALARILLGDARLWLLDEPTVGLDVRSTRLLERAIENHRARGGIVMVSTHIPLDLNGAGHLDLDRFAVPADRWLALHDLDEAAEAAQ